MLRSSTSSVIAAIIVLLAIVAWQFVNGMRTALQVSYADEQTGIFSQMVAKASEAIGEDPPNVNDAVQFLEYTHRYYPSGTKQISGSRLDRIVERSRSLAEGLIIQMLKVATDEDPGATADAWIRAFGSPETRDK